jgi:hypothetical protein
MDALSSQHRQAWELIPWVLNGTASESERHCVEEHLKGCTDCRDELEFQRRLQRVIAQQQGAKVDPHSLWARLREQLNASFTSNSPARSEPRRLRRVERAWMPWAIAAMLVQGVGLGVLAAALWSHSPTSASSTFVATGAYRTLSAPAPTAPPATVRVVFSPTMTLAELRTLLFGARLQVVSGPSDADVWSLGHAGDSTGVATEAAIRALRASPGVRFAEPIGASP